MPTPKSPWDDDQQLAQARLPSLRSMLWRSKPADAQGAADNAPPSAWEQGARMLSLKDWRIWSGSERLFALVMLVLFGIPALMIYLVFLVAGIALLSSPEPNITEGNEDSYGSKNGFRDGPEGWGYYSGGMRQD